MPDFFIGAHAMVMSWQLATADQISWISYVRSRVSCKKWMIHWPRWTLCEMMMNKTRCKY